MPRRTASSSSIADRNEVLLTRVMLLAALHDLSIRLTTYFPSTVRLVVHGGAVMVLHPQLACRESTRDVDYLHRSFETEWIAHGVSDAGARLMSCIKATARAFNLGSDWMNSCADVALPMSRDVYGKIFDPIYIDTLSPNNLGINTIFTSPGLILVGVSWAWSVALKLIRYKKHDPHDIANILRLGRRQRNVKWTPALLEAWLFSLCSAMGYAAYPPWQMKAMRQNMRHAIALAYATDSHSHSQPQQPHHQQPHRAIFSH